MVKRIISVRKIPKGVVFQNRMRYSVSLKKGKLKRNLGLFKTKAEAEKVAKVARKVK